MVTDPLGTVVLVTDSGDTTPLPPVNPQPVNPQPANQPFGNPYETPSAAQPDRKSVV